MHAPLAGRPTGEECFLHASARYAADKLDGSRALQTSGQTASAANDALRKREQSALVWTAASLKRPLSRKALLLGRAMEKEWSRFVEWCS